MKNLQDELRAQLSRRLMRDNPWWTRGCIPEDFGEMRERLYIEQFYPLVADTSVRRAVILMGPRRVGKTVLIYHSIARLLREKITPQKIIYISIDTPIYSNRSLEELFHLSLQALNTTEWDAEGYYVFFDEIQYLKDWEVHLKSLVDSYRQCKFIASGSAAAALKMKSHESGAGRFSDFALPPLTFYEYIDFKQAHALISLQDELSRCSSIDIHALNQHFFDYINYGGYPEAVFSSRVRDDQTHYIKNDIIDKVLLRDLPSLYGISDIQELNRLFMYIAFHSGSEFSYETLSKEAGMRKETIKKYLTYLEAAFLIKVLNRVDRRAQLMKRVTSFKIYLTTPSLYCALFSPIDPDSAQLGNIIETAVIAQWLQADYGEIYYAAWNRGREKGEVDLVQFDPRTQRVTHCLEIKWSDRYVDKPHDLKSLQRFLEDNPSIANGIVTSKLKQGHTQLKQCDIDFIPTALYAYWVSASIYKKYSKSMSESLLQGM